MPCALSPSRNTDFIKFLKKKLSPVNKVIKETADSSAGVKQETICSFSRKENKILHFNKKVYSILKSI